MRLVSNADSLLTADFFRSIRQDRMDFLEYLTLFECLLTPESLEELDVMSAEEFGRAIRWIEEEVKRLKGATYAEIRYLLDLIGKYEEPLAYDCLALGLRLRNVGRTDDFTWGDLLAIVRQSPRSSAFYRATNPDEASGWGLQEHLLAWVADLIAVSNWQRGQGKKKDYPKPIPRPGVETPDKKFGQEAIPMDDMKAWLGW
ncbi:hypothetical protein ABZ714_14380 [Streptomyces sp. NPDC006798]|uniref:hypothetical protein n=1 Tax=unclassified Streptomyces TaxID=2593676 RepID=UPI0033F3AEC4